MVSTPGANLLLALATFLVITYGAYVWVSDKPRLSRPLPDVESYRANVLAGKVTSKTLACRDVPDETYDECIATYYSGRSAPRT